MAFLLDTNVVAELRKPKAEPKVLDFVSTAPISKLYISVVSLAEIRFGIELCPDPEKRAALQDWLSLKVRPMFDPDRTLPVSEEILLRWRLLLEDGRKTGHTFSNPDLLIAATAAHYGITVVTRDRSHFDKARVAVINPWDA